MSGAPRLGLRENAAQFALLMVVNAFVGAMVGMERSILPAIAEEEFLLAARTAVLSFIVVFGVTKALTNYFAGRLSDAYGRKVVLVAGWLVAAPVPFLLMWAPSWSWVLVANALLGVSQGLTWSTTVIMKIDLAGPKNRGLAMGLNEFAGYFAVAVAALATGYVASTWSQRPEPFYLGVGFVAFGLLLSVLLVRETRQHAEHEAKITTVEVPPEGLPSQRQVFWNTSLLHRDLSSVSQAGLVNNLNDGLAWGLFPLFFAGAGMSLAEIGWLAAIYPGVWGIGQLFTGALSDRIGRKDLIVLGMWTQAAGIVVIALSGGFWAFATGAALLGAGTAMVYPTLLAAIGDVAHPAWRASSVGIYRLWRDMGYAVGALVAGVIADALGVDVSLWAIAALTFLSGVLVALRMRETLVKPTGEADCISVSELAERTERGEAFLVIDVRSAAEFDAGHVEGARNVPVDEMEEASLDDLTGATVVTVCGKGGGRSDRAATLLRERGISSARSLCGGTAAWMAAGAAPLGEVTV
ncbi:MAG: MFS transporter [Sandaracinaceae bacterium]